MFLRFLTGIRYFFSAKRSQRIRIVGLVGFIPDNWHIYEKAFIPRSASVSLDNGQVINNERLEYLGDAVLDAIVAEYLFYQYPRKDEGFLSKMRSKIVKRKHLNDLALKIGIDSYLSSVPGNSGGKHIHGNALEALIGAIYLDKGYKQAQLFVSTMIEKYIHLDTLEKQESDFKSRVIEWAQKNRAEISFECQEEYTASTSQPIFVANVKVQNDILGTGKGHSKKEAEQNAAEQAFYNLGNISGS